MSETEKQLRSYPKFKFIAILGGWFVGFPVYAAYVLYNNIQNWPLGIGTAEFLIIGFVMWCLSALGVWIMYKGVKGENDE